jgi:hypothetical protein
MNRIQNFAANLVSLWIIVVIAVPVALVLAVLVAGVLGVVGCAVVVFGLGGMAVNSSHQQTVRRQKLAAPETMNADELRTEIFLARERGDGDTYRRLLTLQQSQTA